MAYIDDPETQRANLGFIKISMAAPLLTRSREFELATAWRDQGDIAALHELVRAYTRLVIAGATRFRNYGLPIGDLVQEGTIGLMQATARFDPDRDVRFSTYAAWWIRSAMQDYVLRNWSIVRTGTTAAQKSCSSICAACAPGSKMPPAKPLGEDGRRQIAATLKVDIAEVETMEQRLAANDQSLNAPLAEGGEEHWQDFLADTRPTPGGGRDQPARRPAPVCLARRGAGRAVAGGNGESSASAACARSAPRWRSWGASSACRRNASASSNRGRCSSCGFSMSRRIDSPYDLAVGLVRQARATPRLAVSFPQCATDDIYSRLGFIQQPRPDRPGRPRRDAALDALPETRRGIRHANSRRRHAHPR